MRSGSIAEALLALFTTQDRAASIVGDLSEQARLRGLRWFWFQIARTAPALLWQDLWFAPARTALLVVLACAVHFANGIYVAFPLAQLLGYSGLITPTPSQIAAWIAGIVVFGHGLIPFLMGMILASLSRPRPMTACVAFALIGQNLLTAYYVYGTWTSWGPVTARQVALAFAILQWMTFLNTIAGLSVLAGGYLVRHRALRGVHRSAS